MISRSPIFRFLCYSPFFQGGRELPGAETGGGGGAGSIGGHSQGQKEPNLQLGALCLATLPVRLWVCDSSSPFCWVNLETTPQHWVKARMGGAAVRTSFTHTRPGTAGLFSLPPSPWGSAAPSPPPPHCPPLCVSLSVYLRKNNSAAVISSKYRNSTSVLTLDMVILHLCCTPSNWRITFPLFVNRTIHLTDVSRLPPASSSIWQPLGSQSEDGPFPAWC